MLHVLPPTNQICLNQSEIKHKLNSGDQYCVNLTHAFSKMVKVTVSDYDKTIDTKFTRGLEMRILSCNKLCSGRLRKVVGESRE